MLNRFILLGLLLCLGWSQSCQKPEPTACTAELQKGLLQQKVCGMSLTAPRDPFVQDPMAEMKDLGIDWVALLPFGFFDQDSVVIIFDSTGTMGFWWGETPGGISTSYQMAKTQGLKTMLKPQLWSWQGWIGDMRYDTQAEWDQFHDHYTTFICFWARLAEQLDVDMFCIGTEIKGSAMDHPDYWRQLIREVRQIYSGPITYAPNWDEYQDIVFWDQLDYIGVDAYFSLIPDSTPAVCDLKEAWEPIKTDLKAFSERWNKPILFTEWGYLTLSGCAYETWVLEKDRSSATINQQAQANAAQALLETFGQEDWWAGGFQWKWYADLNQSTRDRSNDYTPQGKLTEDVLRGLYK
ncbi:MAG: glycoside hydrolase family 113 [Aureispira sp.]